MIDISNAYEIVRDGEIRFTMQAFWRILGNKPFPKNIKLYERKITEGMSITPIHSVVGMITELSKFDLKEVTWLELAKYFTNWETDIHATGIGSSSTERKY